MLKLDHISFSYDQKLVLNGIDLSVKAGEHLSVVGESGSGKTTLLKLIYGEYDLDSGKIFWKDTEILGPKHNLVVGYDFMKYVAQEFDLMPYISVEENVGKFLSNFYPEEKQERIDELLEVVELKEYAKTKVQFLSGGQKQRVALARALAKKPEIILLDEPFSHIDNFKKQSLRRNVFRFLKKNQISCIVATHDKNDVLGFADKMMVLNKGKIIRTGAPKELYDHPETPLMASFFGEYSVFKHSELNNSQDEGEVIIYAHQLEITDHSNIQVEVIQCYFNGSNYLVEAVFNDRSVFFYSQNLIEAHAFIFLRVIK